MCCTCVNPAASVVIVCLNPNNPCCLSGCHGFPVSLVLALDLVLRIIALFSIVATELTDYLVSTPDWQIKSKLKKKKQLQSKWTELVCYAVSMLIKLSCYSENERLKRHSKMYLYVKSLTNIDDTTDSCLITLTVKFSHLTLAMITCHNPFTRKKNIYRNMT